MLFDITDEYGLFNPVKAGKVFGWHVRFKGGGGGSSNSYSESAQSKAAGKQLLPIMERAIAGEGFTTPELETQRTTRANNALVSTYGNAGQQMKSNLSRILQPGDNAPLDYAKNLMSRSLITAKDTIRRGFKTEKLNDRDMALGVGGQDTSAELNYSIQAMQGYNNTQIAMFGQEQQNGTQMSNIMGGIGNGGMNALYAYQMGKK